jgi:hypothetical protein
MSSQPTRPSPQPSRRGGGHVRKRVQVLIGLTIALLAVGFVAVAITKTRDLARRTSCHNNLRQIGNGLHGYLDFKGGFPAATLPNPGLPPHRRLSWLVELDPIVHARMDPDWNPNRKEPWDSESNRKLVRGRMPWYVCPASPSERDAHGLALSSYVGITGVGADAGTLPPRHPRSGIFHFDRITRHNELHMGSGIILLMETATDNGPWSAGGRPTARPFDPDGARPVGRDGQYGGLHRGGVNVLFVEGHVEFVRDTVSPEVLASRITISGADRPLALPE